MDKLEQFYETVMKTMTITLATSDNTGVTMRTVSPVLYQGAILFFTDANSRKYRQLKTNPRCCFASGPFFAEAVPEFHGAAMLPENQDLRNAYCEKFPHAFEEGVEFGGRNAEFILLIPARLTGWGYSSEKPAENEIPTIPFEIILNNSGDK